MVAVPQHDWAEIFEKSVKNAANCNGWTDLARVIGVSRTTLRDGLAREYDISNYLELLALSDKEGSMRVCQARADYWEKTAKRLEKRLTDRRWLVEELAALVPVMEPVAIPRLEASSTSSDQVAVLVFSDAHFGLNIPEGQLGYFGTYSSILAEARTIHTFRNFARLAHMQSFPVRKAKVYLLGDNIEHSHMRVIQAKQTDAHVVRQTEHASRVLANCLQFLCSEFEEVEVEAVPGNHGRATAKHGENLPDETFDHLIYYIIEQALSDQPNFRINNHAAWYFVDNIMGFKFLGLHCEDVISWAGIPFYGIERAVKSYYMMLGQVSMMELRSLPPETEFMVQALLDKLLLPDYVTIGHFHNAMAWDIMGVEVIANGALSGVSLYSTKKLRRMSMPKQQMFWVHPEHGVSLRAPIFLSKVGV